MDSGVFRATRLPIIYTTKPASRPACQPPAMSHLVGQWLEKNRDGLSKSGKLPLAEAILGYANFRAVNDVSSLSLKTAFEGLIKLYRGGELWTKTYLILDYLVRNDIAPEGLGQFMRRIMPVMEYNDAARSFEVPAIMIKCLHAACT